MSSGHVVARLWPPFTLGAISTVVVGFATSVLTSDKPHGWWWWPALAVGILGLVVSGPWGFRLQAELSDDVERAAQLVSVALEWASPEELAKLNIPQTERRWAARVVNGSEYPLEKVVIDLRSNNGGQDLTVDRGTVAPKNLLSEPYVLNEEVTDFDPDGDVPRWSLSYAIADVAYKKDCDGSVQKAAR